jgi:hypothetical protein
LITEIDNTPAINNVLEDLSKEELIKMVSVEFNRLSITTKKVYLLNQVKDVKAMIELKYMVRILTRYFDGCHCLKDVELRW